MSLKNKFLHGVTSTVEKIIDVCKIAKNLLEQANHIFWSPQIVAQVKIKQIKSNIQNCKNNRIVL
jgi:hypothetical protein